MSEPGPPVRSRFPLVPARSSAERGDFSPPAVGGAGLAGVHRQLGGAAGRVSPPQTRRERVTLMTLAVLLIKAART